MPKNCKPSCINKTIKTKVDITKKQSKTITLFLLAPHTTVANALTMSTLWFILNSRQ